MGSSPAPQAVGLALVLLGIGATATSLSIPLDQYGRWGARIFPLAGSLSLLLLGGIELLSARNISKEPTDTRHLPAIFALLALAIGYVWAIAHFGYLLSTGVAAPIAMWIFGVRHPVGLLIAALLCPALYHLIFFKLLGVFPPLGLWFDLLDVIGGY
ncbi:tripartite tricarboxylate transporter TctB family protein [Litoreibacter roseus]|uniref:tripartite tricarboxylate transporter TctB family protein n=1 Tax=Litoreibacter roseus TaxID=2601869 RepID=UPI001FA9FBD1|nr:tripartite tricarboxylate transporter TctB family protein [Litoreibacter roseus]